MFCDCTQWKSALYLIIYFLLYTYIIALIWGSPFHIPTSKEVEFRLNAEFFYRFLKFIIFVKCEPARVKKDKAIEEESKTKYRVHSLFLEPYPIAM